MIARRWFDTAYDPAADPAVVREREMIGALRQHADALASAPQMDAKPAVPAAASDDAPASRAELVSQKNCHVLGLTPRQFLELLRRDDAPRVSTVGKLRIVRRDDMLAFVERLGRRVRDQVAEQETDGAHAVLREIGCAPTRRGR